MNVSSRFTRQSDMSQGHRVENEPVTYLFVFEVRPVLYPSDLILSPLYDLLQLLRRKRLLRKTGIRGVFPVFLSGWTGRMSNTKSPPPSLVRVLNATLRRRLGPVVV